MRAKNGYDVSNIAKSMGGGGHVGAAAFTSTLTLNELQDLILIKFREELRKNTFKKSKIF